MKGNGAADSLYSEAFRTLLIRGLGIGLAFVSTLLLANVLGAAEYGLYCAAISLSVVLATLAPLGCDRVLIARLPVSRTPRAAARVTALTHHCALPSAAVCGGACALVAAVASALSTAVPWGLIGLLATLRFLPLLLTNLRQWVALPLVGSGRAVLPEQLVVPTLFILVIGAAAKFNQPLDASRVILVNTGLLTLVWFWSLRSPPIRTVCSAALRVAPKWSAMRRHFRTGRPFLAFSVGCTLLQKCLPLIILSTCGAQATAQFAIAFQCAALAWLPMTVVNLCMLPRCARHYRDGDHAATSALVRRAATLTFLSSSGIAGGVWLAAPLLLMRLGSSYASVEVILPMLLCANVVEALAGSCVPVMQTMKLERALRNATCVLVPAQTGLVFLGGSLAGLPGAAAACLASRTLWTLTLVVIVHRERRILSLPDLRLLWQPDRDAVWKGQDPASVSSGTLSDGGSLLQRRFRVFRLHSVGGNRRRTTS